MKNIRQDKELLLDQLKKTPIVQIACEKLGIARPTFYRWKSQDEKFAKLVDEAINEGRLLVNDLAETNLVNAVKDRNLPAIMYWLKHHHKSYTTKVELSGKIKTEHNQLTPEQEAAITKALGLASIIEPDQNNN
jgi:hypothetical protein